VIQSGIDVLLGLKTEKINKRDKYVNYSMKELHNMLGHPYNNSCTTTAKKLGINIIGKMDSCREYAEGK